MGGLHLNLPCPPVRRARLLQPGLPAAVLFGWGVMALMIADAQPAADWQAGVRAALEKRDFATVSGQLADVLQVEPENRDAHRFQAEWLARRGQLTDALARVEALLAAQPEDRPSTLLQAGWLNQLGRSSRALATYDRWLERTPGDLEVRVRRALVWRQTGELSRALTELQQAVAAEPENTFARYSLIETLLVAGRAHEAWRQADELDRATGRQDAELGLIKAGMLARLDAFALAEELASRPSVEPEQVRRQLAFRAMLRIRQGERQAGLELLAPYTDFSSEDYDALLAVGDAYAAADRLNTARDWFQRAAALTPQRPAARLALARLTEREGRLTESRAQYQALVNETPEALDASLGILRTARALGQFHRVRPALDQARQHAPYAPALYQEELLLALEIGNIPAFSQVLERYEATHPTDPVARLWRLRWRAMETRRLNFEDTEKLLDPFAPDVSANALWLLAATPIFDQVQTLADWQADETLPARAELFRALARRLALRLRPANAELLAARARSVDGTSQEPSAEDRISRQLAAGWWAYVATPFAWADALTTDFDPQAIHIWLAGETQRRLRSMSSEAEGPVHEEWLLRRAVWFHAWRDNWHTPEAANSIYEYLGALIPGAFEELDPARIEDAWRESEGWLPPGKAGFALGLTRARWRQERYDYAGALALYRQLAQAHPEAGEPRQRQAALLHALGRPREARLVLHELSGQPNLNPVTHLDAAGLLIHLGDFEAADRQLRRAEESGLADPLLHLRRAELALARGFDQQADEWLVRGLAKYPDAPVLLAWRAETLSAQSNALALAELIRSQRQAAWLTPDLLASARAHLTPKEIGAYTISAPWLFQWHWLSWQRLEAHAIRQFHSGLRAAEVRSDPKQALELLRPAVAARLPDAGLWLAFGRLADLSDEGAEAERAYRLAHALGLGRPDAELALLVHRARGAKPGAAVRELASRLAASPDDFGVREAFIIAALRAGEFSAAERALAPMIESEPGHPVVRDLTAQLNSARAGVQQAHSLYAAILRGDPADTDRREALRALQPAGQWRLASGYEFSDLHGTTGHPDPPDWREAFAGVFWQQAARQSWALEYRWFDHSQEQSSQLRIDHAVGLNEDWILHAHAAPRVGGDITAQLRLGGGASYRVKDPFFASLDFEWLRFSELEVYQIAPGLSWRWHPRSTLDARVHVNRNVSPAVASDWSVTWLLDANWELTQSTSARLSLAAGDDLIANPIRELVGNDRMTGIGLSLHWGLGRKWTLIPAWRYERHEKFFRHAFSLGARFSY